MKNTTSLSKIAITTLLAVGGITTINNINNSNKSGMVQAATVENSQSSQTNQNLQSAQPVHSTQDAQTSDNNVQTYITLPAGYTKQRVLDANNNRLSSADKQALVDASRQGMEQNTFYDANAQDKQVMVDTVNLNHDQKVDISNYAVNVINSARRQMGKQNWKLNDSAISFADRVANEYTNNNKSDWDADHYVAGITRAAVASGLKDAGQVYEDEAGLPITSQYDSSIRSMYSLKEQVYFNIKQMLFGGYYGSMSNFSDTSHYTEWGHAGDLLGLRSLRGTDAPTKYFGLSFSGLKSDPRKISVHFISVADRYIADRNKFNTSTLSPILYSTHTYKNQWVSEDGNNWYYFGGDGHACRNTGKWINGNLFFFNNSGTAVKNTWKQAGNNWYYFGGDGHAYRNVAKWISGNLFYFNSDGTAAKNTWKKVGNNWYYFDKYGHRVANR